MASTVNGLPVPDDTDPVAVGASAIRALAGKLQQVAAGINTAVFSNVAAANVAITFPVGRFSAIPSVMVTPATTSAYFGYLVSVTAAGATIGARQYAGTLTTINLQVDWMAMGV